MATNHNDDTPGFKDSADEFGADIWASDEAADTGSQELELTEPLQPDGATEDSGAPGDDATTSPPQDTTLSDRLSRVTRYANAGGQDEAPPADMPLEAPEVAPEEPTVPAVPAAPELQGEVGDDQILTVGRGIRLVAKACECDSLLVEGHLEANAHARMLTVTDGAFFIGNAEVKVAEIRGTFEGSLSASERLLIHSTGCVSGTIRYQEVIIEAGGKILGNSQCLSVSPIDQLEQAPQADPAPPSVAESA